ncbi:MAG: hypothetical protein GY708_21045 [Actinomycetia bacterium]|nr:hypothetical protein [Actinomycetes bacterium]
MATTDAQVGWATETTPGTGVTVTDFLPRRSNGTRFTRQTNFIDDDSFNAGRRMMDRAQRARAATTYTGTIGTYVYDRGMLELFRAMFGTLVTTGTGPYIHTFTPGSIADDSLTVQLGNPYSGTGVAPYTYAGAIASAWQLDITAGQTAALSADMIASSETTGTALATYSPPSGLVKFQYYNACVKVDTVAYDVRSIRFNADNGVSQDKLYLCEQNFDPAEETDQRAVTGEMVLDFADLTEYNRAVAGDLMDIQVVMTAGANTITIDAKAEYDDTNQDAVAQGQTPQQKIPFTVMSTAGGTDAEALTLTVVNSEATA